MVSGARFFRQGAFLGGGGNSAVAATVVFSQISKAYQPGKPVLRPLDLTINAGELFFLLGPSGCGKSTLLRILAGLVVPDGGEIFFDGRPVSNLPPEKRRAPMMFQNYALWPHMTVGENIEFALKAAKFPAAGRKARAEEVLALVKLEGYAGRKIPTLSGGQQQRVALARSLAVEPEVLLLDEPLSNLDAQMRDHMRGEIRRLCKERGLTAVYVTHDRREALSVGDRLAVLNDGVLQQVGTPREVYRCPRNRFVAEFLGDANFLDAEILSGENGFYRVRAAGTELTVSRPADGGDLRPGARALLFFRPEAVTFAAPDAARAGTNFLPAVLQSGTYLGESGLWNCACGRESVSVHELNPPERPGGAPVTLAVAPEDLRLLPQ